MSKALTLRQINICILAAAVIAVVITATVVGVVPPTVVVVNGEAFVVVAGHCAAQNGFGASPGGFKRQHLSGGEHSALSSGPCVHRRRERRATKNARARHIPCNKFAA